MPGPSRARDDRGEQRRTGGEQRVDEDYDEYNEYDDEDYEDDYEDEYGEYDQEEAEEVQQAERRAQAPATRRAAQPRVQALSAPLAAREGLQHVVELTGKPASGVISLERADDGWLVGVEVVEDRRIPSSTDILAIYMVEIDADGSLVAYHRTRRYQRGRSYRDGERDMI
jgi:Gas vesicle synthesis protein GvpO